MSSAEEGTAAAAIGLLHSRPLCEAEQVYQVRRACGSYMVSYQHAHTVPVFASTAAAGANCCVLPTSGGLTWTRGPSGFNDASRRFTKTSLVWFAPTSE